MLDRVPTLHANLSATAVPAAVTVEPAPGAVPLVATPAQGSETKSQHRWIGWTLIGAGVAAGATSGILFAINGNNTDCGANGCINHWDTVVPASIFAGVSAAAILGGILYLHSKGTNHSEVALTLQPFGLTLGGRL